MKEKMTTKIVIVTEEGKFIKFNSTDLPTQSPGGIGVRVMMVKPGDAIVTVFCIEEEK